MDDFRQKSMAFVAIIWRAHATIAAQQKLTWQHLLNHLADRHGGGRCQSVGGPIKGAYDRALAEGCKTRDLGGELDTRVFTDAVIARL